MGCDIHTYLEYTTVPEGSERVWWSSWGGRNNLGRNYGMFGLMADGVRHRSHRSFAPKGLPEGELAWDTRSDAFVTVREGKDAGWERSCTVDDAIRWGNVGAKVGDVIEDPDNHSHSWLTPDEYAQVLGNYLIEFSSSPGLEYDVMLELMRALEGRGARVRLVFWFDN